MSAYPAVRAVSETLRGLLRRHLLESSDPALTPVQVLLGSPRDLRPADGQATDGVSLWLYRISRNEYLLNRPPASSSAGSTPLSPLPVDLHYLITPLLGEREDEQMVMGRILQTFQDHAAVRDPDLTADLEDAGVELRVTLDMLSLEDLTRVWNALQQSYSLSVAYQVSVLAIDSAHEPTRGSRVQRVESTYVQIVGGS